MGSESWYGSGESPCEGLRGRVGLRLLAKSCQQALFEDCVSEGERGGCTIPRPPALETAEASSA